MEPTCILCGETVKQIAEEELKGVSYDRKSINIHLSDDLAFPYLLCGTCEDFLGIVIPAVLEKEGILKFDEKKGEYKIAH